MGSKRTAENDGEELPRKLRRQRFSNSVRSTVLPSLTYGQRSVFGDSECMTTVPPEDSDLDCEDDAEALAYLKSVR